MKARFTVRPHSLEELGDMAVPAATLTETCKRTMLPRALDEGSR